MKLKPDPTTAFVDPFRVRKTLALNFDILDPLTDEPYSRDPRNIAAKAEAHLASTGIADTVYFGPEAEFYVFDDIRFETRQNAGYYFIDSVEGQWNTGRVEEGRAHFERLLALRNDVGLLAEEYDPEAGRQLGNFPQAFSHIGLITAAWEIDKAREARA